MQFDHKLIRRMILRALILGGGLFLVFYFMDHKKKEYSSVLMASGMNTLYSIELFSSEPGEKFTDEFEAAQTEIQKIESICNYFDSKSELGRLNASAYDAPFVCSPELWEILSAAREWHQKTDGAFDITITPLMKLWGFYTKDKKIPSDAEIQETMNVVGLHKVIFNDTARSVRFPVRGMSLNLGGIAKGWALDKAAKVIQEKHGIRKGVLNFGGNVYAFGDSFHGAVRDPFDKKTICARVDMRAPAAMSTSGNYERFVTIDGKQYTHIMNPKTGRPVENVFSASVIAPTGLESDVLSTSVFVAGFNLAKKFPHTKMLLLQRKADAPEMVECLQTGDCWELNVPVKVPADTDEHMQKNEPVKETE